MGNGETNEWATNLWVAHELYKEETQDILNAVRSVCEGSADAVSGALYQHQWFSEAGARAVDDLNNWLSQHWQWHQNRNRGDADLRAFMCLRECRPKSKSDVLRFPPADFRRPSDLWCDDWGQVPLLEREKAKFEFELKARGIPKSSEEPAPADVDGTIQAGLWNPEEFDDWTRRNRATWAKQGEYVAASMRLPEPATCGEDAADKAIIEVRRVLFGPDLDLQEGATRLEKQLLLGLEQQTGKLLAQKLREQSEKRALLRAKYHLSTSKQMSSRIRSRTTSRIKDVYRTENPGGGGKGPVLTREQIEHMDPEVSHPDAAKYATDGRRLFRCPKCINKKRDRRQAQRMPRTLHLNETSREWECPECKKHGTLYTRERPKPLTELEGIKEQSEPYMRQWRDEFEWDVALAVVEAVCDPRNEPTGWEEMVQWRAARIFLWRRAGLEDAALLVDDHLAELRAKAKLNLQAHLERAPAYSKEALAEDAIRHFNWETTPRNIYVRRCEFLGGWQVRAGGGERVKRPGPAEQAWAIGGRAKWEVWMRAEYQNDKNLIAALDALDAYAANTARWVLGYSRMRVPECFKHRLRDVWLESSDDDDDHPEEDDE